MGHAALVKLLILTGARRSEIAGVKWSEIDLAAKLSTLPRERAKNGREHRVALSDLAADILRSVPGITGSELVLTRNGRNRLTQFARAKKRIDALLRRTRRLGCFMIFAGPSLPAARSWAPRSMLSRNA
jgi:integrase